MDKQHIENLQIEIERFMELYSKFIPMQRLLAPSTGPFGSFFLNIITDFTLRNRAFDGILLRLLGNIRLKSESQRQKFQEVKTLLVEDFTEYVRSLNSELETAGKIIEEEENKRRSEEEPIRPFLSLIEQMQDFQMFVLRMFQLLVLLIIVVIGLVLSRQVDDEWWSNALLNFSTEIAGLGFAYILVEYIWSRATERRRQQFGLERQRARGAFAEISSNLGSISQKFEAKIEDYKAQILARE